jgi:hypothetical protein
MANSKSKQKRVRMQRRIKASQRFDRKKEAIKKARGAKGKLATK